MAGDQFIDPQVQANLNKLVAALAAKQGELTDLLAAAREAVGNLDNLSLEAVAADQERARALSASRPPGAGSIEEATALIEKQAQAERDVNAQIARQIELQAQAVAAARGSATAAQGAVGRAPTPAGLASDRIQAAVLAQEQAQLRSTQTELEEQIRAASATLQPKPTLAKPGTYDTAALAAQVEAQLKAQEAAQKAVLTSAYAGPGLDPQQAASGQQAAAKAENDRAAASANLRARLTEAADAETALGQATQRNILQFTQGDNALQRHGALTVDFLNAAAKGQVTLREFGDQIGATIGKFAGWTGAAAAVYGAYNAVTDLSKGAIDASNTVGQLHRTIDGLDNQRAAQAIIGLAHDTNTSMKEAGDAVFAFSRTFHDVGDATYAAGLALRAYQLDGVSVADQVKAQTAIHQQFGITAKGLGPIYDELAAGQRVFNARISDQIPLLQRSASAVKNAGGDLQTFIELSTIALRTTQLSGSQLGTAFLRSASTFLNPATTKGSAGRAVLASLGIDPNQDYTDLIVSALKRSATLSNAQRQQLSLAVFGPLLGGRTAGFFTGGANLLGDVQKQLAPGAVKGTFLTEFATEIGTTQQQLKALGNNLQQLGAELGQSGLGAPLGGLVYAMNELLTLSTKMLGIWSQLPTPIKDAAGAVAAAYGVRAVTQRAGVTGVPFFGRSQSSIENAQALSGLQAEQEFYQQQYTSTVRQAATAGISAQSAARLRTAAAENGDEEQALRAEQAYQQAVARRLQLDLDAEALQQQALDAQTRLNAVQARINQGQSAQAALAAEGVAYQLNTLERGKPVANPVVEVGGATTAATATATAAAAEAEQLSLYDVAQGELATAVTAEAAALGEAAAATEAAGAAIGEATVVPWSTVVGQFGDAVGRFLPWLFAIGLGASAVVSQVDQMAQATQQLKQTLDQAPGNLANARSQLDQAAAQVAKTRTSFLNYIPLVGSYLNDLAKLGEEAFKGINDKNFSDTASAINAARSLVAAPHQVTVYEQTQQRGPRGEVLTASRPAFTTTSEGDFTQLIQQAEQDRQAIAKTQAGREKWYQQLAEIQREAGVVAASAEQGQSTNYKSIIEKALQAFKDELQGIYQAQQAAFTFQPIAGNDPFAQFRTQSTDNIVKGIQAVSDRIKIYGADTGSLKQLAFAYAYLTQQFAKSNNDKDLQAVSQAQSLFVEAVRKDAQDLIDQADVATTKGGKLALLHQAAALLDNAKAQMTAADNALKAGVATDQAAYEAALKAQADATLTFSEVAAEGVQFLGAFEANQAVLRAQVQKTAAAYNAAKSALSASQHAIQQVFSQLDQSLKTINTQTAATTKVPKVPSSQDPFELTRLRRELQQARDQGDPVKAAQDAVGLAHDEIAAARNEHERLQGLIDLANAENQLNKAIEDRTQSYYTYLESTTTDPIKQAQIALKAAAEAVQNATKTSGKGTKDYYDAKAKFNDAQQKLVDAQVSGKESDIQFYLDMGDISVQTAIQEYQALLSMHNLTKAQRQRILEDIKKLKDGSASQFGALDLGTIRLPTPYEIRRALLAAQQYGNQALTQQTYSNAPAGAPPAATLAGAPAPQIHVHVYNAADVPAVGATLSRFIGGSGKSLQRAAGLRGSG